MPASPPTLPGAVLELPLEPAPAAPAEPADRRPASQQPAGDGDATGRRNGSGEAGDGPLDALLRDLGGRIQRGGGAGLRRPLAPTGQPALDALLGGGLARGRIHELCGPAGGGRTSLALSLLAHATRQGEWVAWLDGVDAFDPASAKAAGVALDHLLWVRTRPVPHAPGGGRPGTRRREAPGRTTLRCLERLLGTDGFTWVVAELDAVALAACPESAWLRLARRAAGNGCSLIVSAEQRCTGPHCEVALAVERDGVEFSRPPALLEASTSRVTLARHRRAGGAGTSTYLRWSVAEPPCEPCEGAVYRDDDRRPTRAEGARAEGAAEGARVEGGLGRRPRRLRPPAA